MSEQPPANRRNGNGIAGKVATLSSQLMRVLPPAFLLLVILNVMSLGIIAWVFDHNAETRNVLLTKIVERCLLHPRDQP